MPLAGRATVALSATLTLRTCPSLTCQVMNARQSNAAALSDAMEMVRGTPVLGWELCLQALLCGLSGCVPEPTSHAGSSASSRMRPPPSPHPSTTPPQKPPQTQAVLSSVAHPGIVQVYSCLTDMVLCEDGGGLTPTPRLTGV